MYGLRNAPHLMVAARRQLEEEAKVRAERLSRQREKEKRDAGLRTFAQCLRRMGHYVWQATERRSAHISVGQAHKNSTRR